MQPPPNKFPLELILCEAVIGPFIITLFDGYPIRVVTQLAFAPNLNSVPVKFKEEVLFTRYSEEYISPLELILLEAVIFPPINEFAITLFEADREPDRRIDPDDITLPLR